METINMAIEEKEIKVDEVTEDSKELRDEITNKVLPALKSELDAVSGVTGAWAL